jgi:ABC-type multidrug transport system fused ATPase/permease subunit
MGSAYKKIIFLLTIRGWKNVIFLWLGMVAVAIFEVLGVASVMPFIGVASRPEIIETHPFLHKLYLLTGATNHMDFLLYLGCAMLFLLVIANVTAALVNWRLLAFTYKRGHELSKNLLEDYISKPYIYFLSNNTSQMNKMVLNQVSRVVTGVIIPSMQLVARGIVLFFMLVLLITINPFVTLGVFGVAGGAYMALYFFMRKHIKNIGQQAIKAESVCHKAVSEVLGGIKEVKLLGNEDFFINRFSSPSRLAAHYHASSGAMSVLPRYLLETIAFSAMVIVILVLLSRNESLNDALPILALYALIGYRMLPALQQVFYSLTLIRFHTPAMLELCEVLSMGKDSAKEKIATYKIKLDNNITLKNISFTYPQKSEIVLQNINLQIPARKITAFVGTTGSGKSTLADIIAGILQAQSGEIYIDNKLLDSQAVRSWQNIIGYVPQQIFLVDDTVRRNIAFGIEDEKIDENAVIHAAKMAQIDEFITSQLADGYNSHVGERGVRLSGGQRQRIGLARALYHDPQLLVLDEATSALDNATERSVMETINTLGGSKTIIIIAHRLSTVQQCQNIVLLKNGRVEAQGNYQELLNLSPSFARLVNSVAEHSESTDYVG